MTRRKKADTVKSSSRRAPAESKPKVAAAVRAARELGLEPNHAEERFLRDSQHNAEGNPLQGRPF